MGADFDDMLNRARYGRIYTIGDTPAPSATDSPAQLPAPTVTTTASSIDIADASSDADGLANRVFRLYADAACAGAYTANVTGKFTGLNPNTRYCYKVDFDTLTGGPANYWVARGYHGVATTAASTATPGTTTDNPPDLRAPTVTVTTDSIAIVNTSTDADGLRTGNFYLYANTDHTGLLATNTTGVITGLVAGTAYGFKYDLEYRNGQTGAWIATAYVGSATTTASSGGDTTPPAAPTLTATPQYTNQNSVTVEVNGEAGAAVWVNGLASGLSLGASGKTSLALDTTGADGVKSFSLTLQDAAGNSSGALALNIEKGTVAPGSVTFVSAAPDMKGANYTDVTLSSDRNFAGASITVTSRNGGTILGVSINGSGQIVIGSYDTPNANPDYLDIAGTDKYGNAIAIALRVNLPN